MGTPLKFSKTVMESVSQARSSARSALTASKYLYALTLAITIGGFYNLGSDWMRTIVILNAFSLFFATAITSLIGSADTIGIDIPRRLSSLVVERQFWLYALGLLLYWVLPSITGILVFSFSFGLILGFDATSLQATSTAADIYTQDILLSIPLAIIASAYVTARMSMLLPAIAAGEPLSLKTSWKRSTGNVFKIAVVFSLTVIVGFGLQQVLKDLAFQTSTAFAFATASIAVVIVTFCQSLLNGTLAGMIYRQLHI